MSVRYIVAFAESTLGKGVPKIRFPITRNLVYVSLFLSLLCPTFFLLTYGYFVDFNKIYCAILPCALAGSAGGLWIFRFWEKKMQASVTQIVREKIQKIAHNSHIESDFEKELELLRVEFSCFKEEACAEQGKLVQELKHKELLAQDYQRTIAEQRLIIEKKQQTIVSLEVKLQDLMNDLRGLLQIETRTNQRKEVPLPLINEETLLDTFLTPLPASRTVHDTSLQLKKYITKAENLTGVDHLGNIGGKSPRFLDLSLECYTIDRRRLFDCFKDETVAIIYIYSPLEKKFLFVNFAVKSLTGWSPEKFAQEFAHITIRGYQDWEEALSHMKQQKEWLSELTILNKAGHPRTFECLMGLLQKGPFTNHALGLLLPK